MSVDMDEFDYNLSHLSPAEFIMTCGSFADSLLNHEYYSKNWVDFVTHPQQLKVLLDDYKEAHLACELDGGKKNQKERDDTRHEVHLSVVLMGQFCVMKSVHEKNPALLNTVALKRKTRPVRNSGKPVNLIAPAVSLKHGDSRTIIVIYNKVPGAGSNEIQVCLGDPNDEASWRTVGIYKGCRVPISGYDPGTKLSVRVRCHGTGDPGPFSQVVSIIVL
jgi:hypothetical protein